LDDPGFDVVHPEAGRGVDTGQIAKLDEVKFAATQIQPRPESGHVRVRTDVD